MGIFRFSDMPLKKKITLIAVVSSSVSLLMACLVFILSESLTFPRVMRQNLSNLAQIIGDNSTAALSFNDSRTAQGLLDTLKANPHILSACLYDLKGQVFARYARPDAPQYWPAVVWEEKSEFSGGSVRIFQPVLSGGDRVGTLYLESDTREMQLRMMDYTLVTVVVGVLAFLISLLVASRLQQRVTGPLQQVVDRMKDIAKGEGDLTKRLEVTGKDEIGEVAEAFNTFVGKLQGVEDMKLDLISVVSHQLKTPVAEINGFIENMMMGLTGELNPKQKTYLDEMRAIGRENYRLITDLLSASKIDRGVVTVDLKPVSTKEVVGLAIRDYEVPLARKGLSLELEGVWEGGMLYADRDKLVEALRNLINNAIKCTDKGSITVRALTEGDMGVIEVADTGIGMDAETMGRLFTKNRVLGKEAHRSGAGLGLYITKNFMKQQNGDITVTSEKGRGTCFKLAVPRFKPGEGGRL